MRAPIVILAGAALGIACLDFWISTRGMLGEQRRLRERIVELQDSDVTRFQGTPRNEWPPSVEQLARLQRAAEDSRTAVRRGEHIWFARAQDPADYLIRDPQDRPGPDDPLETRENLRRLLLGQATRLGRIEGPQSALGIEFPGTTRELSADPAVLRDQVERALILRWALDQLADEDELTRLELEREKGGALWAALELRAPPRRALAYFDRFLEPSTALPPRRLRSVEFSVIPPSQWRPAASEEAPPLRLRLRVELERPRVPSDGPARATGSEEGA